MNKKGTIIFYILCIYISGFFVSYKYNERQYQNQFYNNYPPDNHYEEISVAMFSWIGIAEQYLLNKYSNN